MNKTLFILLLMLLSFSCTKKDNNRPTSEQLIQAEISKRIASYEKVEIAKCHTNLLEQAAEIVDSTLIARAKAERVNPLERPLKPLKPSHPEVRSAKDTTAVAPLIDSLE